MASQQHIDMLNQINHDNWYGEDDCPDFVEELKACAYNIVRENPGIERSEWIDELIRQYPTEVVDAYGVNPLEVFHDLSDLWEMEYTDPETHEWNSFAGWSEYLMTDPDALQDQLYRAKERIRELEAEVALLKARMQPKSKFTTPDAMNGGVEATDQPFF